MNEFFDHIISHWFANSYARLVVALFIIFVTIVTRIIFVKFFNRFIASSTAVVNNNPTNYKFLKHAVSAVIYLVGLSAAVYSVPALRAVAGSMLAGAGILAVVIGFASQQAFSNIVAGIFIIIFKPFRVNDRIQLKDTITGVVEDVTLRHTVIRNYENRRVIIPNSVISQEVLINADLVEEKICKRMDLGIGYGADLDLARKIIQEEVLNHPNFIDNRSDEDKANKVHPVNVRVTAWQDFSINLRVWVWAKDAPSAFQADCDLLESIKRRFDKEGIEIPFPYRNVVMK